MRLFIRRCLAVIFTSSMSFSVLAGQLCTAQMSVPVARGEGDAAAYDFSCIVDEVPAGDVTLVDVRPQADRQARFRRSLHMSPAQLIATTRLKRKTLVVFDGAFSVKRSAQLCHQLKSAGFSSVVIPHASFGELARRFGVAPEAAHLRDFAFLRASQVRAALGDGAWYVLAVGEPHGAADSTLSVRWFPDATALRSWLTMASAAGGGIYRYLLAGEIAGSDLRDLADLDHVFWTDARPAELLEFMARIEASGGIPAGRSVRCAAS